VKFQALKAMSMKMSVFWEAALYMVIALMMKAVSTYETSVNFNQTIRRNIPEDRTPQQA
jgi:hypothetical protein